VRVCYATIDLYLQKHLGFVHAVTVGLVCDPFAQEIVIQMNLVKKSHFAGINIIAVPKTAYHGIIVSSNYISQ